MSGFIATRRLIVGALTAASVWSCSDAIAPGPKSDFAVLARAQPGFEQARRGHELQFPRDHGAHSGYRIEWWYLTANLQDEAGRPYGVQWTLFRTAISLPRDVGENPWQHPQVFMAHFALTTPDDHLAFQRYARGGRHGGLARAGAEAHSFKAWLDDWRLYSTGDKWLPLQLEARARSYAARLRLDSDRALVLQGNAGFSQKHQDGGGSHYYSQPFLLAAGELELDGRKITVTGEAWLDREWSSQFLQPDQAGWDWFALHLKSGEKLMLFRLRPARDASDNAAYVHGALFAPSGAKTMLDPDGIQFEILEHVQVAGRQLPLHWLIRIPQAGRLLEIEALHPDQWMKVDFPYWEGVVQVRGDGPRNAGRGYLELTGYPPR